MHMAEWLTDHGLAYREKLKMQCTLRVRDQIMSRFKSLGRLIVCRPLNAGSPRRQAAQQ
jgi:hypothetical protein